MSEPKIHLGVSGIVCVDRKILLGKRVDDDPSFPGMWCTPGGGVEFGETLEDALRREFLEETGAVVGIASDWTSIQQRIKEGDDKKHTVLIFKHASIVTGHPAPKDGFSDLRWFSVKDLLLGKLDARITLLTATALARFITDHDLNRPN